MDPPRCDVDRHLFFRLQQSSYLDGLNYRPGSICVLEVAYAVSGELVTTRKTVNHNEFNKWTNTRDGCITKSKGPGPGVLTSQQPVLTLV
jgi:hypothetical protein